MCTGLLSDPQRCVPANFYGVRKCALSHHFMGFASVRQKNHPVELHALARNRSKTGYRRPAGAIKAGKEGTFAVERR